VHVRRIDIRWTGKPILTGITTRGREENQGIFSKKK
jgi:hypothetical protein